MSAHKRTVSVADQYGDSTIRLALSEPDYGAKSGRLRHSDEIGTGVFARALWIGRKYVVLLTYSQWVMRDGSCQGDTYRLCTPDDERTIRHVFGDEAAERALDVLRVPIVDTDGQAARP